MLNKYARAFFTRVLTPIAHFLLRHGVSPDVVTIVGTAGVVAGALAFYPRHEFFLGTVVITLFVFSDLVDGQMARLTGRSTPWGAFLDSTLDRVADAAVFGGLAWWFARGGHDAVLLGVTLFCLVSGALVSYARARAEGLGMRADVGVAERAERMVISLVVTGFDGLGVPYVQAIGLWVLAVASAVTLVQRVVVVRRQALPRGGDGPGACAADSAASWPSPTAVARAGVAGQRVADREGARRGAHGGA
jgi:CDP-diacylglycerol--glycerol-3-phosphate 3-phosphatidyltransferase